MIESLTLQAGIILPALLAGVLILSTHVPLGREVLQRGIIFLDLAIAQMAALGLILSSYLGLQAHGAILDQLVAMAAAVVGASLLYRVRHAPTRIQEALIGVLFMLAATGSILLLSKDPHGGERLREMLVGQILWVEYTDLIVTVLIYLVVLALWFGMRKKIGGYAFYPLFAVTITLSTQLVGIYLVFASLIIPALASLHSTRPLITAYSIGLAGYFFGLLFSALFDFPSGAMITWCLAVVAGGVAWISRAKGMHRQVE
ncbi:metal ABC transporter permease [Thiohalophilus thiocyanatoxydans]|uniref:Zinc/manganese transport system permease protein n=1 Tax=Thiohalophilus thiocyanatoxydans TaxID=381308 RepID=A0A4R8ISF5_9GAMM|nr:metal ABC transporter permease [Thiohalophilus thiocyanatoxydans]TDY03972.1 zinc/manganese transport system permease protein [Thiohalophilus thiocyanatoxydans]